MYLLDLKYVTHLFAEVNAALLSSFCFVLMFFVHISGVLGPDFISEEQPRNTTLDISLTALGGVHRNAHDAIIQNSYFLKGRV